MGEIDSIKKPIVKAMDEFERYFRNAVKSSTPLLDIITRYIIKQKGKQIRPMLVFLSAEAAGGIKSETYTAATLVELLHTATLIHDDVVDESFERRGLFSINALWKSKVAVLVGDYLLSKGLLISLENNQYQLLHTVSNAVKNMSEGELQQIKSSRLSTINLENYFEIVNKKTASLFRACTLCGVQSAGATKIIQDDFANFGENLGIVFQIKDDLFDYLDKGMIGKPVGNDIKDKKFTLPLILSLESASKAESNKIVRMVHNNKKDRGNLKYILDFVKSSHGMEKAQDIMFQYRDKALSSLTNIQESEAKQSLIKVLEFTINRNN